MKGSKSEPWGYSAWNTWEKGILGRGKNKQKRLKCEHTWGVPGTAKRPVHLEKSEREWSEMKSETAAPTDHVGPCWQR